MIVLNNLWKYGWRIKTLKYHDQVKRFVSYNEKNGDPNFQMYTTEQQLTVINTLHKCVLNNITRTYLNEKRLQRLKPLFEDKPSITSLEPLLSVSGFGPKILQKICDSILQDSAIDRMQKDAENPPDDFKSTPKLKIPSGLLTPSFLTQVNIESVISIKIGINTVSWARLRTGEGQLDSWDLVDISHWADKKYDIHSVYDLVMNLRDDIPDGDLYILENNNWSNVANVKKPMKYDVQEAMLTTALCSVFNLIDSGNEPRTEMTNRVYFIRSYVPFRMFSKVIGSEKVSAEDIVLNMISGVQDERFRPISFIDGTANRFLNHNGSIRDSMCQSLLLVVSFTELIMYKNPLCLSIISKPMQKKKKQQD